MTTSIKTSGMLAEFTIGEMCQEAELVVEAHVEHTNVTAGMVPITDDVVISFTVHALQISSLLKRPSYLVAKEIFVITLGAQTDDISEHVGGEAQLRERRRRHTFFFSKDFPKPIAKNDYTIFGGFQGKFVVTREGNEMFVSGALQREAIALENFRRIVRERIWA